MLLPSKFSVPCTRLRSLHIQYRSIRNFQQSVNRCQAEKHTSNDGSDHTENIFKEEKDYDTEPRKITSDDLSSALKHTSKLNLSKKEQALLDEEGDYFSTTKFIGDTNKSKHRLKSKGHSKSSTDAKIRLKPRPGKFEKSSYNDRIKSINFFPKPPKLESLNENNNSGGTKSGSLRNTKKHIEPKVAYKKSFESKVTETDSSSAKENSNKQESYTLGNKEEKIPHKRYFPTEEIRSIGDLNQDKIPKLAHNLDRTLFSPGVHYLQDPRTRVYNFAPYLKKIIKIEDFDFEKIEKFVTVSKDETLLKVAIENKAKFYSSTSSMTSTLTQFYLFLNNYDAKSPVFKFPSFTKTALSLPSSVVINQKGINPENNENIYSVESDKSMDKEILLSAMGHCLEALLTNEQDEFNKFTLNYKNEEIEKIGEQIINRNENENNYNYAKFSNFLMRSQLDCYDERLPGKGTFDLKTRAVCSIRYDQNNPDLSNNAYQIWKSEGMYESFEREYNDLIRSGALLKYGFQARIGQMDGIFVAYHNINTFFGFQYLPLSEIDKVFYRDRHYIQNSAVEKIEDLGDDLPTHVAETQFKISINIWESIIDRVLKDINTLLKKESAFKTSFRLVIKQKSIRAQFSILQVSAVPLTTEKAEKLQKFPESFRTSFKEDIKSEHRLEELEKHYEQVKEFNQSTVDESPIGVLNYDVIFAYVKDGETKFQSQSFYPSSKNDKYGVSYKIMKREPEAVKGETYLKLLNTTARLLSPKYHDRSKKTTDDQQEEDTNVEENQKQETKQEKEKEATTKEVEIDEQDKNNIFRFYSAIGKARSKVWQEKDEKPIVYIPKRNYQ